MPATQARIVRWGNSLAIRVPKNIADEARLAQGDKVLLQVQSPGTVLLSTIKRHKLDELLERITPENLHKEINWGKPVGGEVW